MNFAVSLNRCTLGVLLVAVAGCSSLGLESKKIDYKSAAATAALPGAGNLRSAWA